MANRTNRNLPEQRSIYATPVASATLLDEVILPTVDQLRLLGTGFFLNHSVIGAAGERSAIVIGIPPDMVLLDLRISILADAPNVNTSFAVVPFKTPETLNWAAVISEIVNAVTPPAAGARGGPGDPAKQLRVFSGSAVKVVVDVLVNQQPTVNAPAFAATFANYASSALKWPVLYAGPLGTVIIVSNPAADGQTQVIMDGQQIPPC